MGKLDVKLTRRSGVKNNLRILEIFNSDNAEILFENYISNKTRLSGLSV